MPETADYPTFDPRMIAAVRALMASRSAAPVNTAAPQMPYPTFNVQPQNAEYGGPQFGVGHTTRPADAQTITDEGDDLLAQRQGGNAGQAAPVSSPGDLPVFDAEKASAAVAANAPPATAQPSQYEQDAAALRDLYTKPVENTNSRLAGAGRLAAYSASQEARRSNSLGRTAGAAAAGLISGLFNKRGDEQAIDRPRQIARAQERLVLDSAEEKERSEVEARAADTRLKNANANYTETQKPLDDAAKREDRVKRQLLSQLTRMPSIDPQKNAAFLSAWQRVYGEPLDVDAWNNKKGNIIVRGLITDPSRPQEKNDVSINLATGEQKLLGLSGYTPPRDTSGMSETERRSDADRDRAFSATERQRQVSNELHEKGLTISQGHLDLSRAAQDNRFSAQTRKELGDANKLVAEAERWQQAANDVGSRTQYTDPNDGKVKESRKADNQRDLFAARAASLRQQAVQNYGYLFGGDHMTTGQFKSLFPSLDGNWSGEAQRLGVTLSDDPMQGPVTPSPTRRGAPARGAQPSGSTPQSSGRFAGHRMSRANLPAAAKALGVSTDEAERIITREGGVIY